MKLLYGKSKWEMWDSSLQTFLKRAREDGFDAVEIFIPSLAESPEEIRRQAGEHGLGLIAQIVTEGENPCRHEESLKARFEKAAACKPLFICSHTGRDHFSFEENLKIFQTASQLSAESAVPIVHETHRGRPLFSAPETRRYLEALPGLRLNADFSHWFCVHESDLSDQPGNVAAAIERTDYIHARVGFEEGPQVPDPLAPEWLETTHKFLALWRRILERRAKAGAAIQVITPEFGPVPYMPSEPYSRRPMADAWETNVRFRDFLRENLEPIPA